MRIAYQISRRVTRKHELVHPQESAPAPRGLRCCLVGDAAEGPHDGQVQDHDECGEGSRPRGPASRHRRRRSRRARPGPSSGLLAPSRSTRCPALGRPRHPAPRRRLATRCPTARTPGSRRRVASSTPPPPARARRPRVRRSGCCSSASRRKEPLSAQRRRAVEDDEEEASCQDEPRRGASYHDEIRDERQAGGPAAQSVIRCIRSSRTAPWAPPFRGLRRSDS